MDSKLLVICLDAGMQLGHCGFIGDEYLSHGTLLVPPAKALSVPSRLHAHYIGIIKVVGEYKKLAKEHLGVEPRKVVVVTEDVTQSFANTKFRNKSTWLVVASYSLIFLACGKLGVPVVTYAPSTIKKGFCGNGRATKEDMMRFCQEESEFKHLGKVTNHVVDALAMYTLFRKGLNEGAIKF